MGFFFLVKKTVMDNQKDTRLGCSLNPSCSIQQLSKTITRALHPPTFFFFFLYFPRVKTKRPYCVTLFLLPSTPHQKLQLGTLQLCSNTNYLYLSQHNFSHVLIKVGERLSRLCLFTSYNAQTATAPKPVPWRKPLISIHMYVSHVSSAYFTSMALD